MEDIVAALLNVVMIIGNINYYYNVNITLELAYRVDVTNHFL